MLWERLRRLDPRIPDVVAVALLLIAYIGWADRHGNPKATLPMALVQTLPLLVRRRYPIPVLGVVVATALAANLAFGEFLPLAPALAMYTVASACERPEALRAGAVALAILAVPSIRTTRLETGAFVFRLIAFSAAWLLGDTLRTRRAYVRELEARAERLEREREANVRRAAAEEQARIARELHDVIAHNVSVMVVQAAAANEVFDAQPERARDALRSVEATGRAALTELRRLLGSVRGPAEDGLAPQPGLADLRELVAQVRAAGLSVSLHVQGELADLPAGVDLSAYRIVQEALTNTLKHAHASTVDVEVRRTAEDVELEISDDGVGGDPGANGGRGLIGMRERASLLGGEVEAGRASGGGFCVRARLPVARKRVA